MKKPKKRIAGAFLGTIVEYYDYSLYGFSAGILAEKFFPTMSKIESLTYVFAIYAISYLAKPFGSIFFSHIGDFYGRKISLRITMIGIAFPTLTIGLLPDYHSIGNLGAYILVICRFLQGFFVAGEYDGAVIYVVEHIGKKHHYAASATARSTGVAGLLLGIAATNFFNSSIFPEWCWRIPFLLSVPLTIVTIYYRKFLEETPEFMRSKAKNTEFSSTLSFIKKRWRTLLMVILLSGGFGVTYQVSIIFMKQYLPMVVPYTGTIITTFSVIMVLGFGLAMPVAGILADRFGCERLVKYSLLSTLVASGLLIISINHQLINLTLISCLMLAVSVAPFNALAHGVIIKAFKPNERYRGVSLGHTTGSMLMSGTANYVCLLFMQKFGFNLFPIFYIGFFAIVTFVTVMLFTRTYKA
ncbi:MAG: MFS transporter [Rickettsiales bacterium]|nr:MAG: MFS transporter [Rickettsiales bacterium]